MQEFLKWMQAGLASLALTVFQLVTGGTHPTGGAVAQTIGVALLVRAAGWVIQKFGPQAAP